MTARVSVVIPLYNKRDYVREAIESVLAQTADALEIIVVDDGSTDGGGAVVEGIADHRIRLVRQSNAGVSAARNKGIDLARGDVVAFLDADDRYRSGFIARIQSLAARFPESSLLATSYCRFKGVGPCILSYFPNGSAADGNLVRDFYSCWSRGSFFSASSAAVRRSAFADPSVRFPAGESLGEDQDLWFRLAELAPVAFSSEMLAEYRLGVSNSATALSAAPLALPSYERLAARLTAGQVPSRLRRGAKRVVAVYLISRAERCLARDDIQGAGQLLFDSRTWPAAAYRLRVMFRWFATRLGLAR